MSNKSRGPEPDFDTYMRYLLETDSLREQTNLDIIEALDLPAGSSGLDVGLPLRHSGSDAGRCGGTQRTRYRPGHPA